MDHIELESFIHSEGAADFIHKLLNYIINKCNEEMKNHHENTEMKGVVNVYFFMENFIFPLNPATVYSVATDIVLLLDFMVDSFEGKIKLIKKEEWSFEENKMYHLGKYKEFLKKTKIFRNKIKPGEVK